MFCVCSDSFCRKGKGSESNYVCSYAEDCNIMGEEFQNNNYPIICSFNRSRPIICCLPKTRTEPVTDVVEKNIFRPRIADQSMCRNLYSISTISSYRQITDSLF